jgi:hypothetical protein
MIPQADALVRGPRRSLALPVLLALALPVFAEEEEAQPSTPPPAFEGIMSAAEADPSVPRGLLVHEAGAYDGYTLYAPLNSRTVYLVDLDGEVVHTWETDSSPAGGFYLLDDGTLLRCGREDEDPRFRGGGIGGIVEKLAPDGTVLWRWQLANDDYHQHHDIEPLPNGNVLLISWERISAEEAVANGRDPEQVGRGGLWPDTILEIEPAPPEDGKIVWHLIQDFDRDLPNYGSIPDHPELIDVNADHRDRPPLTEEEKRKQAEIEKRLRELGYVGGDEDEEDDGAGAGGGGSPGGDWLHTNAVAYHAELDLIVLSTPHLSELWIIDHSTTTREAASHSGGRWGKGGDLLWRWGNPRTYGAGGDRDRRLYYQHDPTWVAGDDGELRLLVFNNGSERWDGDYSSADELVLPFDPAEGFTREPGRPFGPEDPAWSFDDRESFFSAFISGAQRLPNGTTLICSGAPGRLFEVTPEGRIVWDYRNPHGGEIKPPEHAGNAPPLALFRGTRLAREHAGVQRLLR